MKTKLYTAIVLFFGAMILIACSKKIDSTPKPPQAPTQTSLTITVTNDMGNAVSDAFVYLYSSLADLTARTNQLGNTLRTDTYGKVTISGSMATIKYYWWAESGCQNNIRGINSTAIALTANTNNTVVTQLAPSGTLKMINTSGDPYEVYINGTDMGPINGGGIQYYVYQPVGSLTVRVLQLNGFAVYPDDETFTSTISCSSTSAVTFP